jgi:16S rRNA (guanine966-N2)-methyltransferase
MSPGGASRSQGGVRATGGTFRGRPLSVPAGARPTEARVREALFSIWRDPLETGTCNFLDLFAGSGVVAIEAAGRGALHVLAIDHDAQAVRLIAANVSNVAKPAGTAAPTAGAGPADARPRPRHSPELIAYRRLTLPAGLARLAAEGPFDLIFADPPYNFDAYQALLDNLPPLLAADGEIAVEHSARRDLPPIAGAATGGLVRTHVRRYGESSLSFYRHEPP